ncbi:MAG: lytic transglycosylase domain-containing protein, partial [Alphaproteobacteria bacterium]|nr:lytic transglycosylase domain-containing protein [Alphaproteobacteria bacterium]
QQDKNWKSADKLIKQLDSDQLKGRVLSQRYLHPTGWRSTYKQLRDWLQVYNDHPAASRIYWLSKKRRPNNAKSQKPPKKGYLNGYGRSSLGHSYVTIPASSKGRASPSKTRKIARDIRRKIRKGWPTGGLNMLTKANLRYLTKYEEAVLRADLAHGYFIYGKDKDAIEQAQKEAYWTAGIAAWRSGQVDRGMEYFRVLAEREDAPSSLVASAAFWASRGELRSGNAEASFHFLEIAARHQDTFYGTLAAEALGQDITLDFDLPVVTDGFIDWLMARPGGQRLFALLQVGETYHASRELRYLWEEMSEDQQLEAMALAAHTHMAGVSFRTADIIRQRTGVHYYGGLYPVPDFETAAPIRVDQALLLAVMRQESGFNPRAKSWAKASGLMQLMPATAAFISRDRRFRGSRRHDLMVPSINIKIGEDYILHLLDEPLIEEDLVKLLAAYNGGPGNLNKWMRKVNHNGDVLMLLESLPSKETRFYVKNVMTNLWIYRKRLNQEAVTVANLVGKGKARYMPFMGDGNNGDCQLVKLSERCK